VAETDDWMPLRIGIYMRDTLHLTRDQHGAYLLLLMAYWTNGGPLPADDARLATIAHATKAEWKKLKPIMLEFFMVDGGRWHQKRAEKELAKAVGIVAAKSKAGKIGADTRWQKHGTQIADASICHRQNDAPLPTPSQKKEDDDDGAGALLARVCEIFEVQLQADPARITWRSQIEQMLKDGLDAQRIIAAAELTRIHGKKSLMYLRAIAFNPPKPPPIAGPPPEQRRRLSNDEMDAVMKARFEARDAAASLRGSPEADEGRVLAAATRREGR